MRYYLCPVCGYDRLDEPPMGFSICSCCGTEFELDDDELSHYELRKQWIDAGYHWWSPVVNPPIGWNPIGQLRRAGYIEDSYEQTIITVDTLKTTVGRFVSKHSLVRGEARV